MLALRAGSLTPCVPARKPGAVSEARSQLPESKGGAQHAAQVVANDKREKRSVKTPCAAALHAGRHDVQDSGHGGPLRALGTF